MVLLVTAVQIVRRYCGETIGLRGEKWLQITFLVTQMTNRKHGPLVARRVVYAGFMVAVALSLGLATPRIALASGTAFLCAQLLDIRIFSRIRESAWWCAPFYASLLASLADTMIFFTMAFWGEHFPWVTLAAGDFCIKLAIDVVMLLPFRLLTANRLISR